VPCDDCGARRYNEDVLEVKLHGQSIADVLEMPCGEAVELFASHPRIARVIQTLCDVGLDYVTLGQSAPTLSGGEAQRVKLAAELARPATGHTIYLLDEPTTGLHFGDIEKLLVVMQRLVDLGNSVIVIEHNLDVIKCCDWLIDIGPGAGVHGGQVVFAGTPEGLAAKADPANRMADEWVSSTAPFLADALAGTRTAEPREVLDWQPTVNGHVAERREANVSTPSVAPKSDPVFRGDASTQVPLAEVESETDSNGEEASATMQPWRVLGRRWHTLPKGFPENTPPQWPLELVERMLDLLSNVAGEGAVEYPAPDRVSVRLESGEEEAPLPHWAELETKVSDCVRLKLSGPQSAIDLEQLLALDVLQSRSDTGTLDLSDAERVTLTFHLTDVDHARSRKLKTFLKTHLDRTRSST
jgi:excinuclease ABC subunit A